MFNDPIDYDASYDDIVDKDSRYHPYAYAFLEHVVALAFVAPNPDGGHHVTGAEVLDMFKEEALDVYGPLAYTVLTEWGVTCCEDIGAMMFNLVDAHRIRRDEGDSIDDFMGGYDFADAFLGPFKP